MHAIQPVNPKGNQSWIFSGNSEAETPIVWPCDAKNWLIGKDPEAGKVWRREEKGITEDEMVVWHHQLNGHEFEQALGAGDGQGSLTCCRPWGCKESDMTEWLNWTQQCMHKCSLSSTSSPTFVFFCLLDYSHSNTCERISHCGFDFISWQLVLLRGEGDYRGWDGWMVSRTEWTWVWVNSGSYWWTGRPGVLQSIGSQWVRHDWATELTNWLIDRGERTC